jgi:predicted HicB family RNase H-like nuclease
MELNVRKLGKTEKDIYREARRALNSGIGAAAFAEKFFGPGGRLATLCTSEAERRDLVRSDLYKWLQARAAELRKQEAQRFEQEVESCSGRLTIVVPRSLHAALKEEAGWEGVSLSELIRLKLGVPYRVIARQDAHSMGIGPRTATSRSRA